MRFGVATDFARVGLRGVVLAAVGTALAGCSTDVARMSDNPLRFASASPAQPELTGTVHSDASYSAPVSRVEAQPLGGHPVSEQPVRAQPLAAQALPAPPPAYRSGTGASAPPRAAAAPEKIQAAPPPKNAKAEQKPKPVAAATAPKTADAASKPKQENVKVASLGPAAPAARMASPAAEPGDTSGPSVTGAAPSFRWPVRGRVIAGYGAKTNGQQNDGINIAVPEGTSVKASEDGVVAYAGNELKGYGNLVLIRHSNGFVTAYAHASEVAVKRGDTVKRGQIIGKAGQTGTVSSPQLHFEIRKGSTPVDPSQHLSGT